MTNSSLQTTHSQDAGVEMSKDEFSFVSEVNLDHTENSTCRNLSILLLLWPIAPIVVVVVAVRWRVKKSSDASKVHHLDYSAEDLESEKTDLTSIGSNKFPSPSPARSPAVPRPKSRSGRPKSSECGRLDMCVTGRSLSSLDIITNTPPVPRSLPPLSTPSATPFRHSIGHFTPSQVLGALEVQTPQGKMDEDASSPLKRLTSPSPKSTGMKTPGSTRLKKGREGKKSQDQRRSVLGLNADEVDDEGSPTVEVVTAAPRDPVQNYSPSPVKVRRVLNMAETDLPVGTVIPDFSPGSHENTSADISFKDENSMVSEKTNAFPGEGNVPPLKGGDIAVNQTPARTLALNHSPPPLVSSPLPAENIV